MKNPRLELLRRKQRQHHRRKPNWVGHSRLFIPHCYAEPRALSWWDDVGLILNGRRVMVWWVHPRMKYQDAIEQMAFEAAEPMRPKERDDLFETATKIHRKQGRSRKKVAFYQMAETREPTKKWLARVREEEARLTQEADLIIRPSLKIQRLDWCTGIELCAPLDIRTEADVHALAALGRRLVKREITVDQLCPDYAYRREDWLHDQTMLEADRAAATKG